MYRLSKYHLSKYHLSKYRLPNTVYLNTVLNNRLNLLIKPSGLSPQLLFLRSSRVPLWPTMLLKRLL